MERFRIPVPQCHVVEEHNPTTSPTLEYIEIEVMEYDLAKDTVKIRGCVGSQWNRPVWTLNGMLYRKVDDLLAFIYSNPEGFIL